MAQGPEPTPGRDMGRGYDLMSIGITFAVAIVAFVGGGLLLDRWLSLTPLFTIVFTLVGSGLSLYWVYTKLMAETEREKRERDEGK